MFNAFANTIELVWIEVQLFPLMNIRRLLNLNKFLKCCFISPDASLTLGYYQMSATPRTECADVLPAGRLVGALMTRRSHLLLMGLSYLVG